MTNISGSGDYIPARDAAEQAGKDLEVGGDYSRLIVVHPAELVSQLAILPDLTGLDVRCWKAPAALEESPGIAPRVAITDTRWIRDTLILTLANGQKFNLVATEEIVPPAPSPVPWRWTLPRTAPNIFAH